MWKNFLCPERVFWSKRAEEQVHLRAHTSVLSDGYNNDQAVVHFAQLMNFWCWVPVLCLYFSLENNRTGGEIQQNFREPESVPVAEVVFLWNLCSLLFQAVLLSCKEWCVCWRWHTWAASLTFTFFSISQIFSIKFCFHPSHF